MLNAPKLCGPWAVGSEVPPILLIIFCFLLRYVSHSIKFPLLKYTMQWFVVFARLWMIIFINLKETPFPSAVAPHFLLPPAPRIHSSPLPVSTDLSILRISYKWNHNVGLLSGFLQSSYTFKVHHRCCDRHHQSIPFCHQMIFQRTDTSH